MPPPGPRARSHLPFASRALAAGPLAALLAGCGDSAGPRPQPAPPARPATLPAEATATPLPATGDPVRGRWDAVPAFPAHVAIHAHLLPNARVLFWPGEEGPHHGGKGSQLAFVWDAATGTATQVDNRRTDVFCSGHTFLADGRLLVSGGHVADGVGSANTNYFDPALNRWTRGPDMALGRWYPTTITLANGDVLTIAGTNRGYTDLVRTPEVLRPGGSWRRLTGVNVALPYYPWMFVIPDGRVFYAGAGNLGESNFLTTDGAGSWAAGPRSSWRKSREYGSAVMFAPGKVLVVGGGGQNGVDSVTNTAERIDLGTGGSGTWQSAGAMQHPRRHMNATLLPDGRVLAVGGTSSAGFNNATRSVYDAEVWSPASNGWTTWAAMRTRRIYHSTALLLPDGRVLAAGGGRPAGSGVPDQDHPTAELFSPPYLFAADGSAAPRPAVTGAPAGVTYRQAFDVRTPDAGRIQKVTLVRLGSVTHAFDMNQRFVPLAFARSTTAGDVLRVTAPAGSTYAPPGHYMLFLLDAAGVPSVARVVRLG